MASARRLRENSKNEVRINFESVSRKSGKDEESRREFHLPARLHALARTEKS